MPPSPASSNTAHTLPRLLGRSVRRLYRNWEDRRRKIRHAKSIDLTGQAAHDHLRERVESRQPFMAARFGHNELKALTDYGRLIASYHTDTQYDPERFETTFEKLSFQAGFFPLTPEHIARFYHRVMADTRQVDVLGSWLPLELDLHAQLRHATRVELHDLDPVIRSPAHPWTASLQGKRVLVVHPFDRSIRSQYQKRTLLFDNPAILPEFELITLRAVQNPAWTLPQGSAARVDGSGQALEFSTWFEALAHMEQQIEAIDFDVAIIGCGAYGFSLASYVKRMGRQAVHLGGITQMLFGIKGERWLNIYGFSGHNEHWVYPLPEETPVEAGAVEKSGTYWGPAGST